MERKSLYVTSKDILMKERYIINFYDELKDEVGGEIYYDKNNDYLRCKWHDWNFCKDTGKCQSYPIKLKLNPYDFEFRPKNLKNYTVKLKNDEIYLNYEK